MATTLETLKTRLEADTAQYNAAMRGARKTTDKSTKGINKAVGSMIVKFASFAAAVMIARKAYRAFTESLARIDKLAKTARFLGMTTEALAGLQHLGNLTGVSMGNLETAMMRMTRAIGEAATGAREYLEPFERIGVDVQKLLRLAPEKQMAEIAEGISKLATQTEQGSIAMEIFGRSGMRMRNLLREGTKGFHDAQEEAKRFGLAVSEIDAKKVEDANDAVTRLTAAWTGLKNELVIEVAPAIEETAGLLSRFMAWRSEQGKKLKEMGSIFDPTMDWKGQPITPPVLAVEDDPRIEAEKKVQKELTDIQQEGKKLRDAFDAASNTRKVQMVAGSLRDMVSVIGTESRTMFEISKGLAYGEAVINTIAGITRNLRAYPQPLAGIMAGITAAAGAAQIAAIAATQYQKGGGGAGAGAATAGAGAGAAAGAGGGEAATPLDVSVVMQGDMFGPAQVRDLIGKIDDELSDGVRMRSVTISG